VVQIQDVMRKEFMSNVVIMVDVQISVNAVKFMIQMEEKNYLVKGTTQGLSRDGSSCINANDYCQSFFSIS